MAAATRLTWVSGPRKKTRRAVVVTSPGRPASSSSVTTWLRISIQVPSRKNTTNTKRKLTLKLIEAAATSMKKDSSAGVAQVAQAAAREEPQQDQEQQEVHHAVQQRVGEVEQIHRDGHRGGDHEAPAERRAHRAALARLLVAPAHQDRQHHQRGARRPDQVGEVERGHARRTPSDR